MKKLIIKMKRTNRKESDNTCRKMVVYEENNFQETTSSNEYECKTCKKRFKSFQALGGHQGIHKKKPNKDQDDDLMCLLSLNIKPTGSLHQCKKCSKVFETGQMLGGHMRKHRLEKLNLWKQNEVLTTEELERHRAEEDERMWVRKDLILAAKELRLWF